MTQAALAADMALPYRPRVLLLDHDDTAVRSTAEVHYPAHVQSVRELLGETVQPCSLEEWFEVNHRPGVSAYLASVFPTPDLMEREHEIWTRAIERQRSPFFPGFPELLAQFRARGGRVCVISHSQPDVIRRDYEQIPAALRPDLILGWDADKSKRKPAPWPALEALTQLGAKPEDALVLDDLLPGVQMAKAVGISVVAAGWGHRVPAIEADMRAECAHYFTAVEDFAEWLLEEPPRATQPGVLRNLAAHIANPANGLPSADGAATLSSKCSGKSDQHPTFDAAKIKADFESQGFIHLRGFFSDGEMSQMESELEHFIGHTLPTGVVQGYYHNTANPATLFQIDTMHDEPYFDELMNGPHSRVNSVVEALFGQRAVGGLVHFFDRLPIKSVGSSEAAGATGAIVTPAHQDAAYSSQCCTAWVAVDNADEGNGCMHYSRGSHLVPPAAVGDGDIGIRGTRPHPTGVLGFGLALAENGYTTDEQAREYAVVARRGDLVLHHPLTVHRAGANTSRDRHRRAVGCSYFAAEHRQEYERINANMHARGKQRQPTADTTE